MALVVLCAVLKRSSDAWSTARLQGHINIQCSCFSLFARNFQGWSFSLKSKSNGKSFTFCLVHCATGTDVHLPPTERFFWDRLIFNAPFSQRGCTDIRLMEWVSAAGHFCTSTACFLLWKFKNKASPLEFRPLEWYFILSVLCDASPWFPFIQSNNNGGK